MEAGGSEVQDHPQLHRTFEASLGYVNSYHKKTNTLPGPLHLLYIHWVLFKQEEEVRLRQRGREDTETSSVGPRRQDQECDNTVKHFKDTFFFFLTVVVFLGEVSYIVKVLLIFMNIFMVLVSL